ncbi:hypothetical protein O9929_01980 [Vibrio lentus]|nr:hypothetical protein [Vibrio lentus]
MCRRTRHDSVLLPTPTAAKLIDAWFVDAGLTSLSTIKRETFPAYDPPYIMAAIVYPGASPQEVEVEFVK